MQGEFAIKGRAEISHLGLFSRTFGKACELPAILDYHECS